MTEHELKEMILKFPKEVQIDCLKAALEQDKFGIFVSLSRILLNAPLNNGGLETEIIEQIHNDYLKTIK